MKSKQKYKVFINDQPVLFTSDPDQCTGKCKVSGRFDDLPALSASLSPGESLCIVTADPAKSWKDFTLTHEVLQAAGGVVRLRGEAEKVLVIFRLGKWDLPKGKLDPGESPADGALREVEEECGISGMKIIRRIEDTWHMYKHKGTWKLKQTFWYEMDYQGSEVLVPQSEENIEEARWVTPSELVWLLPDAYASIRELLLTVVKVV